ncbi:MAG: hypothetical protein RIG77_05620 [Cyclobacteriaceae bacterium]
MKSFVLKKYHLIVILIGWCLFFICCSPEQGHLPKEIITVKPNSWRSATIFTHVIWKDLLFYGAGSGSGGGDPRHEMEIGIFHLIKPDSGYHDKRNPVITRSRFGLDQPGKGITPLAIYDRGDSIFMYCTSRPDDDLNPHIVQISASVKDPYSWGNYRTIVDHTFSGQQNNHGASVLIDPYHPENLLLYFAALTSPNEYRILLAEVAIKDVSKPEAYILVKDYENAVLGRDGGKTNYPYVRYDRPNKTYELWYSGHTIENTNTRSCYLTKSLTKDRFKPATQIFLQASEIATRNDNAYATGPKVYGNHFYYSGRNQAKGNYLSIFYLELK